MFEFKQENTGYKANNVSAKPLDFSKGGWQLGDLKSEFFAPHEGIPGIKVSVTSKADLKSGEPAGTKPQADDLSAPKTTIATAQEEPKAAKPELKVPEPPSAAIPIVIPAAFAPVMTAGALSGMQRDQARGQSSSKDVNGPEAASAGEFNLGDDRAAVRRARGDLKLRDQLSERDSQDPKNRRDELIESYLSQQTFMKSAEYQAALVTVNRRMREQEQEMVGLRTQIAQFDARLGQQKREYDEIERREDTITQENNDLKDLKGKRDTYDQDVARETEMYETRDAITQESFEAQSKTIKIMGKDAYVTITEDGQPVVYKIDETGQKTKVDSAPISIITEDPVYILRNEDGTFKYVDHFKREVSQDKKEAIERALKATGAKPEDIISDHFAERAKPQMILNGVTQEDMDAQTERTNASQRTLEESAKRIGIPVDQLKNLEEMIASKDAQLLKLKQDKQKIVEDMSQTEKARNDAQKSLNRIEAEYKESKEFKQRLENGEFKNEKEMIEAMPKSMRKQYETAKNNNLAEEKAAPAQAASQTAATATSVPVATTASTNNTSRANGSASETVVTASTRAGPPFADAAAGVTPAEPSPAEMTPDQILTADHTQRSAARSNLGAPSA